MRDKNLSLTREVLPKSKVTTTLTVNNFSKFSTCKMLKNNWNAMNILHPL